METGFLPNQTFTPARVNGLCEYLLVAYPDAAVTAQVREEKKFFAEQFTGPAAPNTKPYIKVADFLAKEEMESTIIRWMHRIISNQKKFKVTLDRYSGFKPHTIYLRVQDHAPFQQITRELQVIDPYVKGNGCPGMQLGSRPCLIIAGKLPDQLYQQAISCYAQKIFHACFEVNELVLLRKQHQFDSCKQVSLFAMQP